MTQRVSETFADRLSATLKQRHMSQAELSRKASISRANVSRYMNGDGVSLPMLVKLADVLDVSTDYLTGRTDETH